MTDSDTSDDAATAEPPSGVQPSGGSRELRLIDAIREALFQRMQVYPDFVLMGQDIAEYGGAFKITEGFVEAFGRDRVRNTPLCESGIIGVQTN